MSAGPHAPDRIWFPLAVTAVAALAVFLGWVFYAGQVSARSVDALGEGAREELAALVVPARATAAMERTWVQDGFPGEFLIAPVGPMPCPGVETFVPPPQQSAAGAAVATSRESDPDVRIEQLAAINDAAPGNLVVTQILGTALVEAGSYSEAERVLSQGLASTNADEEIIRAARVSSTLDLDDVAVSTVIHLHHALGVARLSQSSSEPPWVSLKNVIGSVKPLSRRRLMGTTRGQPVASRLLIAAPGCPSASGKALSSYDLFNNLIVGYMKKGQFKGGESERAREFARPKKNYPSPLHRLLLAQVERAGPKNWQNEAQLWALSNVEQVIDWRLPDDARLALNSVLVIDWWTAPDRCPAELCTPDLMNGIRGVRDSLIETAFRRRNVAPEQRTAFAREAVGLLATSNVDRSRIADAAAQISEWLPPSQRTTLDDLMTADSARAALPRFLFAPKSEDEPRELPHAKLGPRADRWYATAMTDAAASAAKWAAGRPPAEQRAAIIAIRQLLGSSEAPPELTALERQRPWLDRLSLRMSASKWFWALVAILIAAVTGLILLWLLVHFRERRLLRISFYNVELDHLATIDAAPRPEGR